MSALQLPGFLCGSLHYKWEFSPMQAGIQLQLVRCNPIIHLFPYLILLVIFFF